MQCLESNGTLDSNTACSISTIMSLESPGCNNPTDKHSFFTSSLLSLLEGFSYFLKVISAKGESVAIVLGIYSLICSHYLKLFIRKVFKFLKKKPLRSLWK